jgi:hypothetical protein
METTQYDYVCENIGNLQLFSRYVNRTDRLKKVFEKDLRAKSDLPYHTEIVFVYHALLYVCIEAYKEYNFNDKIIEVLIGDDFINQVNILRKMRNSVFHPDNEIFGKRQQEYIDAADIIVNWAYILNCEFDRFIYFFAEDNKAWGLGNELRRTIRSINNWLPNDSLIIKQYKAKRKIYSSYNRMIEREPGRKNQYEKECTEAINSIDKLVFSAYEKLVIKTDILT